MESTIKEWLFRCGIAAGLALAVWQYVSMLSEATGKLPL